MKEITTEELINALQEMNEFLKQVDNDMAGLASKMVDLEMRVQELESGK